MNAGPNARAISNRVFNDIGTNLFSERGVSEWVWAWGQFLDHDLGLRDETRAESAPIPFMASDPPSVPGPDGSEFVNPFCLVKNPGDSPGFWPNTIERDHLTRSPASIVVATSGTPGR
jgi:hypothetical protein